MYRSYSRRIGILFGTIPTLLLLWACIQLQAPAKVPARTRACVPVRTWARSPWRTLPPAPLFHAGGGVIPRLPNTLLWECCGGRNRSNTRGIIAFTAVFLVGKVYVLVVIPVFSRIFKASCGTTHELIAFSCFLEALRSTTRGLIACMGATVPRFTTCGLIAFTVALISRGTTRGYKALTSTALSLGSSLSLLSVCGRRSGCVFQCSTFSS